MGGDGPVWAVVVAAGSGARYGAPKQYEQLEGRRVLDWSLAGARAAADGVVLVVSPARVDDPEPAADVVVAGGATRSDSVRAGLAAVPEEAEVVIVHDAARPAASPSLFAAVVAAVRAGADGAVPGVAVVDTIKRVDGDVVVETLDRGSLVAVQTPQAFRAGALRAAHASGADATDDGALVEAAGGRVVVVTGEPDNVKVTTPADLERLARR
jgi:2-C-methyl-D-erythritol 4-phosphate cytidylyltransferase